MPIAPTSVPHNLLEDILAIFTGTVLVSLGVALFKQAGLFTGGTAGMAFLIHYASDIDFGWIFFLVNLPFYWFAIKRMGWKFTLKTFISVTLVSIMSSLHPKMVQLSSMTPYYAAIIGGSLMGVGFIVLFRHQASLGGINILTLYLQDKYRTLAGTPHMGIDLCIVLASYMVVSPTAMLASIIGAIVLNLAIMLNHRPGRYMAV